MDRGRSKNSDSSSDSSYSSSDDDEYGPDFIGFAKNLEFTSKGMRSGVKGARGGQDGQGGQGAEGFEDSQKGTYEFPSTFTKKEELPKTADITTLFLIDSVNRDKVAFPQPTTFSVRLPRVYKNVKTIQLTQVKLLCSFYYFSVAKSNITLSIIERGRESITSVNNKPITKEISIREGTYSITDLLSEIQLQLNYTPLFHDFPNGFLDFINIFSANGDYSINFNQPGDTYYDSLNSKFITNPTMATIISYYWGSRYANLTSYSINQMEVAYYYPVLYEVLLDLDDKTVRPKLNLTPPPNFSVPGNLPIESYVIFNMTGINDPYASHLIEHNISLLDTYRINHTFRYSLVNRYQLSYDPHSLRVNFTTLTLNTSLVNLLNNKIASINASAYNKVGLTSAEYSNIQAQNSRNTVIYTDMFNFLQTTLAIYVGIPYGTYSSRFFNTLTNSIYFQNGINASSIRTNYDITYLTSGIQPIESSQITYTDSPVLWPRINSANGYITTSLSNINPPRSMIPFNVKSGNFNFGTSSINSVTSFLNANKVTDYLDIVVDISASQYTIIKFKSPIRQTLQVETLPIPYYYRYTDYNKAGFFKGVLGPSNINVPQNYFDLSYSFIYNSSNQQMDIQNYVSRPYNPEFGISLIDALSYTPTFTMNSLSNYYYFEYNAPSPSHSPGSTDTFLYNTYLSFIPVDSLNQNISTVIKDNITTFLYHDRGAFMADLGKQRSENPLHYIGSKKSLTGESDVTMQLSTFSGNKYYIIFRSDNLNITTQLFKLAIYFSSTSYVTIHNDSNSLSRLDPYANPFTPTNLSTYSYVINYNKDFQRLPVLSTLMEKDPNDPVFNTFLTLSGIPFGYDANGVSSDLTDYIAYDSSGILANSNTRVDPVNNFLFYAVSPYNSLKQTYFGENSLNLVLNPLTNNAYSFSTIQKSEVKIVHWYENYYIPLQLDDFLLISENVGFSTGPLRLNDILPSFPTDTYSGNIKFGRGINSIGFLPGDGIFSIENFSFKSGIYPLSGNTNENDPNLQIKFIGVFNGLSLTSRDLTLTSALTVLQYNKTFTYGPETTLSGFSYGTWYEYVKDTSFTNNVISGYTPDFNELLNYDSMYYMVPFNSEGVIITYVQLLGSVVPYPRQQQPFFSTSFINGQTSKGPSGATTQPGYILPDSSGNTSFYGNGLGTSVTPFQSQYEQSIPITTPSIGFKENNLLINETGAPYEFSTSFPETLGLTTFFSEFSDTLYIVNSTSNVCSNTSMSYTTGSYASSLSTIISSNSQYLSSIYYTLNPAPALQNYNVSGIRISSELYEFEMQNNDDNVTTRSFEIRSSMKNLKIYMWGGGGSAGMTNNGSSGGAGAFLKADINANAILNKGFSTIYLVIGRGGEKQGSPIPVQPQLNYGGGGTTVNSSQGGGLSGIFSDPNLFVAEPLLIAGGGGAGGTGLNLGGPGGAGKVSEPLTITRFLFSEVEFNGFFYEKIDILNVINVYNDTDLSGNVNNLIDRNTTTQWIPRIPAVLNPSNLYPTVNTYGISLIFPTALSIISKIRYFGPSENNFLNLPTGFILYNDINKKQILYSNTSIRLIDFDLEYNGQFSQYIFDIFPSSQLSNLSSRLDAWMVVGNGIQYSLDTINWISIPNISLSFIYDIVYIPKYSKWYACGNGIISSIDGINWTPVSIINYFFTENGIIKTLAYNDSIILAITENGNQILSSDGRIWRNIGQTFNPGPIKIQYLADNYFWVINGNIIKKSSNGILWEEINGFFTNDHQLNDITYAAEKYIIVKNSDPSGNLGFLESGIIYSADGISWFDATGNSSLKNFTGLSIAYGAGKFVACGITRDNSSFIKYSIDGVIWNNSNLSSGFDTQRNSVQFIGNKFICLGIPKTRDPSGNIYRAANQGSIVYSDDGINWSFIMTGGYNPILDSSGNYLNRNSSYGPITIIPNMSTVYLEIQKSTNLTNELNVLEFRVYDTVLPITLDNNGNPLDIPGNPNSALNALLDNNQLTTFYPSEQQTVDVINYPFIFTFPGIVDELNCIELYTPNIQSGELTGIVVKLDATNSSVIYTNYNILPESSGAYKIQLLTTIENISTLHINCIKRTPGSIQLSGFNGAFDPNIEMFQKIPVSITRIGSTINTGINNIIDSDLNTQWITSGSPGILRFDFTFQSNIDRINFIRIFNGAFPRNINDIITGISVFTDRTKSISLFSSIVTPIIFNQFKTFSICDINIIPLVNYNQIYIELIILGNPVINAIQFFNRRPIEESPFGYSGDNYFYMRQSINSLSTDSSGNKNGGGGGDSILGGGIGGFLANNGEYLAGGASVIGGGGGGGGYYGGGGGVAGAAGGGGSGYTYLDNTDNSGNIIFNNIIYGTARPNILSTITNYKSPTVAIDYQDELVDSKVILNPPVNYGQGGQNGINSGKGTDGLIAITYYEDETIIPTDSSSNPVTPNFIDGSKLTVFNAQIENLTDERSLSFSTFVDSIQLTQYSNKNWVWYRTYLSLIGKELTRSFTLISAQVKYNNMPSDILFQLNEVFTNISSYFLGDTGLLGSIISSMQSIFNIFQSDHFITTLYTAEYYREYTEIYCILDYLRSTNNLMYPHVNPYNPTLDRILGGLPGFGYWANPFFTNVSYIGFDVAMGHKPTPTLSTILENANPVRAVYGLVMEQSLISGGYEFKDIMAYKPEVGDSLNWLTITQFSEGYYVRNLTNFLNINSVSTIVLNSNVIVQPYTFKNAIMGRLSLFNYSVYSIPYKIDSKIYDIPTQVLNDFEGNAIQFYSFQNHKPSDILSVNLRPLAFTSTMIYMNQVNISRDAFRDFGLVGTLVSENNSTVLRMVTSFIFEKITFTPSLSYSSENEEVPDIYNFFNNFDSSSPLQSISVGKAFLDLNQNLYLVKNDGSNVLYENVSTNIMNPQPFQLSTLNYTSPKFLLTNYNSNISLNYDFFISKFNNIWHFSSSNTNTSFYGARLTSPYDLSIVTSFANQVFYPTHKITLVKTGTAINPIKEVTGIEEYPSYQHTNMFFYKNFSSLVNDINGKFAMEKSVNFYARDTFSGYNFNSYIDKIKLEASDSSNNPDSFYYLAIRGYSPTEQFQSLVRFYLPQRYDFGYISLLDLSNEQQLLQSQSNINVNPDYKRFIQFFDSLFSTTKTYGSAGITGFVGSNISTSGFGDFLHKFNMLNILNLTTNITISTVNSLVNSDLDSFISTDLINILPSYVTARNRITDPLEFSIPFSSCVSLTNATSEQYGLGYNLGFALQDTEFKTVHIGTSFFKILDDYIYLQMNQEFNMNRMDISKPEDFSRTRDSTAQSGVYNSKLMLNTFGSFATTFVHGPVTFNPPIGKIDKLTFSWYNSAGVLLNNSDCEWSGSVQIVEAVNIS
jgi:hypothetical protein